MADTARTLTQILALLADNSSQDISAQDVRDMVVSLYGNYGGMFVHGNGTPTTGLSTTPSQLFPSGILGIGGGFVNEGCVAKNAASDGFDVSVDGNYLTILSVEGAGSTGIQFQVDIFAGNPSTRPTYSTSAYPISNTYLQPTRGVAFAISNISSGSEIVPYISSTSGSGNSFIPIEFFMGVIKIK